MRRISLAAALAVLALAVISGPAHAAGTVTVHIVGAGHVGGDFNCTGNPDGSNTGTCAVNVTDTTTDDCGAFPSPCPVLGSAGLNANADGAGFTFDHWSFAFCGTNRLCGFQVAQNLDITAFFRDTQDPTTTITTPTANAAVRGTIAIKATASDNARVTGVTLNFRGRVIGQFTTGPFESTFDTTTVPDGVATVSSTATDSSNRVGTQQFNVTVDNTKPTLQVTGPDGQTFGPGATPTWTIAANDATSDFGVRCSVVPAGQPAVFGDCTSNTQERLVNPADGRYTLTVRAMDLAGNFVEQSKAFAVDTGPPDTTIASGPEDGSTTTDTTLTWSFGATEPGSTFQCRLFLAALAPSPFGPCSAAASHTVSGLAAGTYTFEARATDVFGNIDPTPARRTLTVIQPTPAAPAPVVQQTTIVRQVVIVGLVWGASYTKKTATKLKRLNVSNVPAGSTVTARCPKGCAKKTFVKTNAAGTVSLKPFATKPLKPRTKITVTVSKPGAVAAVKVLEIQKGKDPTITTLCQPPGAAKPGACA
jgi:hypothetical protein